MTTPTAPDETDGLLLPGLDGTNPLGFLAALGTMRALHLAGRRPRMLWSTVDASYWIPRVTCDPPVTERSICEDVLGILHHGNATDHFITTRLRRRFSRGARALERMQKRWKNQKLSKSISQKAKNKVESLIEESRQHWLVKTHAPLGMSNNTNLPALKFRQHVANHAADLQLGRHVADLFAALGTELRDEKGTMQDTALRTMSGSGHQHFLRFASNLLAMVEEQHIIAALLRSWTYSDPIRNLTLRLDPIEDARFALQWDNPSTDNTRTERGSVLGANALAVLGLSMLPTIPTGGVARTVGFVGRGARGTYWRWPLWTRPIGHDVTMSLLNHIAIVDDPPAIETLELLGVAAVFQSQRLTIGKFRNFTPAQRIG